ncbi:MAG: coenzyme F420-0:L-glutamate ligase [Bdellovibrionales bacterium]
MSSFSVEALRTRIFRPAEDLSAFVQECVPRDRVGDGLIVTVTSKIVSLAEGRMVSRSDHPNKETLVRQEADEYLGAIGYGTFLTIKHGLLIPSAGIDESNAESGDYILFPSNPFASAQKLWCELMAAWDLKSLGVILSDSRTSPLRRGVTGVALAYWGFRAVRSLVGTPDLFGRELRMTRMNLADAMAAAAVMVMGEGRERQPLALIRGASVEFSVHTDPDEVRIPLDEDLYAPLIRSFCPPSR